VPPPPLPVFRHCRYLTGKNLLWISDEGLGRFHFILLLEIRLQGAKRFGCSLCGSSV
jgi:hypothetical protein